MILAKESFKICSPENLFPFDEMIKVIKRISKEQNDYLIKIGLIKLEEEN